MALKSLQRGFVTFAILAFFAVGVLGFTYDMPTDSNGQMSNCSLMGMSGDVICKMTPFEHIATWQNMFAAVPSKAIDGLAALLLLALLVVTYLQGFRNIKKLQPVAVSIQRFREKTFVLHDPLQEAFSSGILNPKIF